jgi:serine/threonine-protein kinase
MPATRRDAVALTAEDPKPVLEKYDVGEEIGHGGMATVYRAHDRRLDRDVAIKVIHRHLRENVEVAARFVSEARAVAKLKHPNIVEVYDVSDEADAERYLVVELVRGTTLRRLLQIHGHMPSEIAAAISIEIAEGLEHAHEHGVIHRDVKPENVLVEPPSAAAGRKDSQERSAEQQRARVKITDFGIAKLLDVQGVTSTGQVLGSPAHMAPEQIEGGDVTVRSDVFGLGVLIYECAVGKLPFDGKNPAQVLRRVLDGKYVPADRARPTVGSGFSRIIDRALAREAADRYATVAEFIAALREELQRSGWDQKERELAEYLTDPVGYVAAYEPRIVERLIAMGQEARKSRDMPRAAACFNRALAFRPDDADLLRQVAGLARVQRLKRAGVRATAIVAGSAILGALAYGGVRLVKNAVPARPARDATARAISRTVPRPSAPLPPAPARTGDPTTVRTTRTVTARPKQPEARKRSMKIAVQGLDTATVVIDEQRYQPPWTAVDLTVGSHSVQVLPPNATCCAPFSENRTVADEEGPGTLILKVKLNPAIVKYDGPTGSTARCVRAFNGALTPGATKEVPMSEIQTPIDCSVSYEAKPTVDVKVMLRAGETVAVPAQSD